MRHPRCCKIVAVVMHPAKLESLETEAFAKQADLTVQALPFIGLLLPNHEDLLFRGIMSESVSHFASDLAAA